MIFLLKELKATYSFFIAFFLTLIFIQPLNAQKVFVMAFAHEPSKNLQYQFYKRVYSEAFHELGYEFSYKIYPSKRASAVANEGLVDGEPQRIYEYAKRYPNLIRVEEPIFINRTLAFSSKDTIKLDGLEGLKNTSFRVDYLRGSVWSKQHLEPLVPSSNLTTLSTNQQGFRKLIFNRSDIFVTLETAGLMTLEKDEFRDSKVKPIAIVGSNFSFPYVHKSHKKLAIDLAKVLKQMKSDGRYLKILSDTMPFMIRKDNLK